MNSLNDPLILLTYSLIDSLPEAAVSAQGTIDDSRFTIDNFR